MRNEKLVGSPGNGNESSPFGRWRGDTTFMDIDGVALLAYIRLSANVRSAKGEHPVRRASCPNTLVVGALTDVEAALSALVADAPITVHEWTLDTQIPSCDRLGIVIIRDVDRMPLTLQDAWLSWLTNRHDRPQIIAMSCAPVFPLVEAGLFRSELYYRLNTVLLDLRTSQ